MCRHLAYVGAARSLHELLVEPPFSLAHQSWAPREQKFGTVNVDGFGVGWYAAGDPRPARYRRDIPIWSDESFADLARVTRSTAVLAAVRSATPGTAAGVAAAAPFASGHYLFSHNGRVDGWPDHIGGLADKVSTQALVNLVAHTDSALLWAMAQEALTSGLNPERALALVVRQTAASTSGRLNLLLHDGERIFATRYGDTLYYRKGSGGVVVASEPADDVPGWVEVPEGSVIVADNSTVSITPIEGEH
jgi:glutamine amidotransferase